MKKIQIDKKALKRSMWASVSRVIGVGLAAGAGSLLHQLLGDGTMAYGIAIGMAVASFALIVFAEYERERGD